MTRCFALLAAAVLGAAPLHAADPLPTVGPLAYDGSGCREGTLQGFLSPEGNYRVRFRDFMVSAVDDTAYAFCHFQVKVQAPAGYMLRPIASAFDGYSRIPAGATGFLRLGYRMSADNPYTVWERYFDAASPLTFKEEKKIEEREIAFSACGGEALFEGTVYAQVDGGAERATVKIGNHVLDSDIVLWKWERKPCCYRDGSGRIVCGGHGGG